MYYIPSTEFLKAGSPFTQKDIETHNKNNMKWETFDEFSKENFNMWIVKMENSDPNSTTCTCPVFAKDYVCKHSIGVGIRLRLLTVPENCKGVYIGQKRKRGKPQRSKAALVFQ